jgi:hypothetical protein
MAITKPHTFADGETIDAARQNANFDEIVAKAADKTGDTLTGTLTTRALTPSANDTYNIGADASRYAEVFGVDADFSGDVTVDTLNTFTFDQSVESGAAPTFVGTNFTGIPAAALLSGSAELTGPLFIDSGAILVPPALTVGVNNYAPTGFASAVVLQLSADTGVPGTKTITGLAGGSVGRVIFITNDRGGGDEIILASESGSSDAANRFKGGITIGRGGIAMLIYMTDSLGNSRWYCSRID